MNIYNQPSCEDFLVMPVDLDLEVYAENNLEVSFGEDLDVNVLEYYAYKDYTDISFDHHFGVKDGYDVELDYRIKNTDGFSQAFAKYIIRNIANDVFEMVN